MSTKNKKTGVAAPVTGKDRLRRSYSKSLLLSRTKIRLGELLLFESDWKQFGVMLSRYWGLKLTGEQPL